MSDSLRPHGLEHEASLSFIVSWSLLKLMSTVVDDAIQPVTLFSSCPQSFPASRSFPISQLFTSGGHRIGISISVSVLPMNIQGWYLLGETGLISLLSEGLSRVSSSTTVRKHQFFSAQSSLWSNSYIHCIQLNQSLKVFCPKPANELQNSEYVFFIDFLLLFFYFCDLSGPVTISPS